MIAPGGSLMLAWQVKHRPSLVVGAGDVAFGRIEHLLSADSLVTVAAPEVTNEGVQRLIDSNKVRYWRETFNEDRLQEADWAVVLSAIDSRSESRRIFAACKKEKIPVNCADIPDICDFYFGSVVRKGPVQIMVSTNGKGPRLARRIRQTIENSLEDQRIEEAVENVGKLRQMLREKAVGYDKATISGRMKWLSTLCDEWTFEEMAELSEQQMKDVIEGYPELPGLIKKRQIAGNHSAKAGNY